MIKILLCCLGGFSSSAIAKRMQDDIINKGLDQDYQLDYYPFGRAGYHLLEKIYDYDVILLCPHLKMEVTRLLKDHVIDKPLYLLPHKVYGMMILEEILTDVDDVISMYQEYPKNPVTFPNEENLLKIKRGIAYRHYYKKG